LFLRHTTVRRAAFNFAAKLSLACSLGFIVSATGSLSAAQAQNSNLEHMAFSAGTGQSDRQTISIRAGETLEQALIRAGAVRDDVVGAVRSLARSLDPRDIRRDDKVTIFMQPGAGGNRLAGFNLASGAERSVTVTRGFDNVFRAREMTTTMQRKTLRIAGVIGDNGLVNAVRELGAPDRAAESIAQAFAYDVDFEREVAPGTEFELMYDRVSDLRGQVVREGEPVFARMTTISGRTIQLYRFQPPGSANSEWFDAAGRSARKFLMRTPINGARLTSGYGSRMHPVLGYNKMHAGIDFGAPIGTPILAAGDGIVTRASAMGGYGNVVDIEHDGTWSTRYGHISRFAPGLQPGDRVKQGDVIAFVGNTGRSTGPHLHYEVRRNGQAINPLGFEVPTGRALPGEQLAKFAAFRARIDGMRREAIGSTSIAQVGAAPSRVAN
jgi:murein DD-endopeptidase MepM/ murein hydrolase activator NlpD